MLTDKIRKLQEGRQENYIFPFFWQHGEKEEVLRHYMHVIQECSIGAVCIESRPHPDFCGEQWWHDMDIILDEAKSRKMKVWILNDSHFPTGFANGAMESQPDELCRQSLTCRSYPLQTGEILHLNEEELLHPAPHEKNMAEQYVMNAPQRTFSDDRLFSVCAWNSDTNTCLDLKDEITDHHMDWRAPEGKWTVYLLHLTRNYGYHRSYINMMDSRSCRVLIDAVYEPHYAHYREYFGNTIAGFFSDEPELGNGHLYDTNDPYGSPQMDYPWSRELEEELRRKLDGDLELLLPLMWENHADAEQTARLRYLYMDTVSRLVQKDFSTQIGTWCREHGVAYIGHLIEDDNHHTRTGSSLGHYFRGLFGQDMAGIDDIGGQVFPQGEDINYYYNVFAHRNGEFYHYLLGKLADSAAAIQPSKRGRAMCEIFGNYGWEAGVRLEKYLVDHFLVRGINHFVPHAFSPKEYPDPDCPPHFYAGGNNPQYRHFGSLMAYTNRVCELMNGGHPIVPAAVLYHAEGDWTGKHMTSDQVCHPLADAQIDYHILPLDVFSDREVYHTRIEQGTLCVNSQSYRTLLIPYSQFISRTLADAVEELKTAGIPVFYVSQQPEGFFCGQGNIPEADCVQPESLALTLQEKKIPAVSIVPADSRIRYRHYHHTDGTEIFMFVNEGVHVWNGQLHLPKFSGKTPYLYDAWQNQISAVVEMNGTICLSIEPLHSRILVYDSAATADDFAVLKPSVSKEDCRNPLPFLETWKRSLCRSIDYPSFKKEKEVLLPDHLAQEEPKFSGFVRYQNRFSAPKGTSLLLEITDAHEGVEVFLNGKSLGIQIAPPFYYELTGSVNDGINELAIEGATTLERENSGKPDVTGQVKEPSSFSGITGTVTLYTKEQG